MARTSTKPEKKVTTKKAQKLTLAILNAQGKKSEDFELDAKVFDGKINTVLMHQAVVTYLANQRKGLASTKTRGQVRGGGKKPWRQKGTGRARVGSIRSPIWKGGGVTFGPKPRSYYKAFPKKMKTLALKSALNLKVKDDQMLVISDLDLKSHKTKDFLKIIKNLKVIDRKISLVLEELNNNLKLATRNIKKVSLIKSSDIHTTMVVNCEKLVVTKEALRKIESKVKKCL